MFSVVTPTRNVLSKVKSCVGSVRGQSWQSFEHIVQDACSSDGTAEWLLAQPDLKVASELDGGMYDAINRGWAKATGDILSWLNADEQYLPGTLEQVATYFAENPDVDFIYGNVIVVNGAGIPLSARRDVRLSHFYVRNASLYAYSCTMFFQRRLLDAGLLRLDDRCRFAADMDLVLRLLAAGKKFGRIEKYLSLFMVDGTNMSRDPRMLQETDTIRQIHNGFKSTPMRNIARVARFVERFLGGGLLTASVDFQYALDEKPNYRRIRADRVSASYNL